MRRAAAFLVLALASCKCGPASAPAGQCCYVFHDGGVFPCGEGGATCKPALPTPCVVVDAGPGTVGVCP